MKLAFWRRNYRDADPIRFYCNTPSPDDALRCVDELGHLGWCINGETSWRGDAWNVDHWDITEEAPPVESEPTMSATEWVRLESALKPKPKPQAKPNDRDPVSAAWRRGYQRDLRKLRKPKPMPSVLTRNPKPRRRPQAKAVKSDLRYRAEEAAAVVVAVAAVALAFIAVSRSTAESPDEPPPINAAHSEVKRYETLYECMKYNPKRAILDCNEITTGINTARRTLFVKLTADGPNGPRWLTEQYCLEENPQAKRCVKEPAESASDYSRNRAGWVVVE